MDFQIFKIKITQTKKTHTHTHTNLIKSVIAHKLVHK